MSETQVRLIVGVHVDDLSEDRISPVIAGCVDRGTWEIIDYEESDKWEAEIRGKLDPGDGSYEWRSTWATFQTDDLRKLFSVETIVGQVAAEETA